MSPLPRAFCALFLPLAALSAQTPPVPQGAGQVLQQLESFQTTGSVLFVAAHPDDEDTQLIAYLARGRGYRTGYLSLNRGEGGQNLIGPEFGDELGVIRTQELLAARRIDGGEQFFSRVRDFGYSKDYQQTLQRWGHDEALADVVRVIREFRPDVIITRFPPWPSHTHGHHTASAVLAVEGFKRADDPKELPGVPGCKPVRVLWDAYRPGFTSGRPAQAGPELEIGGYNAQLGLSYGEIAALSRSNHRTQGFGSVGTRGSRMVYFQLLAGAPAKRDPFEGVDTTWNRYPDGGAGMAALAERAVNEFDARDPAKSVPLLLEMKRALAGLPKDDPVVRDRSAQLDRIIEACLGLHVETTAKRAEVSPGETLAVTHTLIVRTHVPVAWVRTEDQVDQARVIQEPVVPQAQVELAFNRPATSVGNIAVPQGTPLSTPYWLREQGTPGRFRVDDPNEIGKPEVPSGLSTDFTLSVGSGAEQTTLVIHSPVVDVTADPARGEIRRLVQIVAPVSLAFAHDVNLFTPGSAHEVEVDLTAVHAPLKGTLRLEIEGRPPQAGPTAESPAAAAQKDKEDVSASPSPDTGRSQWRITPLEASFSLSAPGQKARLQFNVTAPARIDDTDFRAVAAVGGQQFDAQRIEIKYEHIPPQLLQPPARAKTLSLDLKVTARRVGYLPGAGDSVAEALQRMGCAVTTLTGDDLTPERLRAFDAVVIGIRAFNVRTDLASHLDGLFAYVAAGGTVVTQYNTPNGLQTDRLGPYEIELERDLPRRRITNEKSPITFLAPDSPALNRPNKITLADFDGWVQERGLNFPSDWDQQHYTPILSSFDPGEAAQTDSLLVAHYGRGYYVYTGLSFFRQLPAGVPGAYRLFANLISLGTAR